MEVYSITKSNFTSTGEPFTDYIASYINIPITIGTSTYNGLDMHIITPKDRELYSMLMHMYLHP
jgi:hypothetical protein